VWDPCPISETRYWIYAESEPVTNATGVVLTEEDEARRLALELSEQQRDATISVVSRKPESAGEWTGVVARYMNGAEIPSRWRVDFHCYLMDADHVSLSRAGIVYEAGHAEVQPGGVRGGVARHVVTLEADGADAAVASVQEALGPRAEKCSEWRASPARRESMPGR
jgi:hypothetical protein